MALQAQYASTPVIGMAELTTTVETNARNPTGGNLSTVLTGGASGTRISKIIVIGTGSTTAAVVRLWLYDNTNYRLIREIAIPTSTISNTAENLPKTLFSESTNIDFLPIVLPSTTWSLRASISVTQGASAGVNVIAIGANL